MTYNKSIKGKLFKYFRDKLGIKPSTKGWYRSDCPYCGGKYCFGLHLEKNRVKCFKCNENTNPIGLLMYMEKFEKFHEASSFLKIQQEYERYEANEVKIYERTEVLLPDNFTPIGLGDSYIGQSACNYLKKRGFNINELMIKGVGYCTGGEYLGYIVFPFYIKGKLNFFQGRRFVGLGPKMKNPKNEDFGVGKTEIIYNQDALFLYDKINLVESITNALTLGDNTIAVLGKRVSSKQLSIIISSPCTHVTILLDDDAIKEAIELALSLCNYKQVRLVFMPKGQDVNDLGRKETRKLIKKFEYQKYMYFYKLRLNVNQITLPAYNRKPIGYSSSRGAS